MAGKRQKLLYNGTGAELKVAGGKPVAATVPGFAGHILVQDGLHLMGLVQENAKNGGGSNLGS